MSYDMREDSDLDEPVSLERLLDVVGQVDSHRLSLDVRAPLEAK